MTIWVAYAVSLVAVAIAQTVKGIVGFGSALIAVPVLTMVWGPTDGLFLVGSMAVVATGVLLPEVWHQLSWPLLVAMGVPLLVFQYLATGILTSMSLETFELALAVVVLVFGADMAWRPVRPGRGELEALPDESRPVLLGAGVAGSAAGVLSGLFGTPGPPLVFVTQHHFTPSVARANMIAILAPASAGLPIALLLRDAIASPGTLLLTGLALVPAVVVGGLFGARIARRFSTRAAARTVGFVLVAAGIAMLV